MHTRHRDDDLAGVAHSNGTSTGLAYEIAAIGTLDFACTHVNVENVQKAVIDGVVRWPELRTWDRKEKGIRRHQILQAFLQQLGIPRTPASSTIHARRCDRAARTYFNDIWALDYLNPGAVCSKIGATLTIRKLSETWDIRRDLPLDNLYASRP